MARLPAPPQDPLFLSTNMVEILNSRARYSNIQGKLSRMKISKATTTVGHGVIGCQLEIFVGAQNGMLAWALFCGALISPTLDYYDSTPITRNRESAGLWCLVTS